MSFDHPPNVFFFLIKNSHVGAATMEQICYLKKNPIKITSYFKFYSSFFNVRVINSVEARKESLISFMHYFQILLLDVFVIHILCTPSSY